MTFSARAVCLLVAVALPCTAVPALAKGRIIRPPYSVSVPEHLSQIEVSETGGLGRVEIRDDLAAVLQRDEGIVALVDVKDPSRPKVLGRYDDGAVDSLDGDLAFSSDGNYLIYARQTREFSKDGVHVLDISDPANPALAMYQPGGGTLRVEHYDDGSQEWVIVMDAIAGMIVYAFEPTTGQLAPVHVSALPALKVGGPASADVRVEVDPILDIPLLYASTGRTGVEIFDFSQPADPVLLGSWAEVGLAEIEVRVEGKKRTIYGASEYWFDGTLEPTVSVLDASDLGKIKRTTTWSAGAVADPEHRQRLQGMYLHGGRLLAAHSEFGLMTFRHGGVPSKNAMFGERNEAPGVVSEDIYTFDVEVAGGLAYVTDAATGTLTLYRAKDLS